MPFGTLGESLFGEREDDDDELDAFTTWYKFVVGLATDCSSFPFPFPLM